MNEVTLRIVVAALAAVAMSLLEFRNPSRWNCLARWLFGMMAIGLSWATYRAECSLWKLTIELGMVDRRSVIMHNLTNTACVVLVAWAAFIVIYGTITYRHERWLCGG